MTAPAAARRVTPTSVRVLPADADRTSWLKARRHGIGSSDVPGLLGASEFKTPLHVWHDKRGELEDTAGEAALWGNLLEDTVAREWARRNRSVIRRVGLVAHEHDQWMLATLDRQVLECPLTADREACALEVKCRNAFSTAKWKRNVPDDVLAQTMWQMAVTGYRHIHVAVLIGGNDYRQTTVRWEQDLADYITGEVRRFRDEHLLTGRPPAPDLSRAVAYIELDEQLHPDRGVVEVDVEQVGDVDEYARVSRIKSDADKQLKQMRARLAELAGGARYVTHENRLAYELAPRSRTNVDVDLLAERWPDAYKACVSETAYHQIQIAKEFRNV